MSTYDCSSSTQVLAVVLFEIYSVKCKLPCLVVIILQAKGLGADAAEISGIITGQGLLNHDQRIQVAIAASDIFGASAQSLQQASGQIAWTS